MSTTRRELILGAVGAVAAQPLQALAAPRLQVRIWPVQAHCITHRL